MKPSLLADPARPPAFRKPSRLRSAAWITQFIVGAALRGIRPGRGRSAFVASLRNAALWFKVRFDHGARTVVHSYFDPGFYLASNHDIAAARILPFAHFLLQGYREHRNPSVHFMVDSYRARYPDVDRSDINPLLHYALFGRKEQRFSVADPLAAVSALEARANEEENGPEAVPYVNEPWPDGLPLVSVIIVSFNYGAYVREALDSVLDQTFRDFEVIVVEGGSTDPDSVEQVRRIQATAPPNVRFLYRTERHLAGDNRNAGISAARGRYIVCLDADDRFAPTYLEAAVFLAERYGYDIVYPSVQCFGASDLRWNVLDAAFPRIFFENQISTVALFRKTAWSEAGGYRDWGVGADYVPEDWDLWLRMMARGCTVKSIASPLMLYRVHEGSLSSAFRIPTAAQCQKIQAANRDALKVRSPEVRKRKVVNPDINLARVSLPSAPAVLFALPYITIGGAEKLMATVARGLVGNGRSVVVTTSVATPASVPERTLDFDGVTGRIYNLPYLFGSPLRWRDFYFHLLRTANIDTILLVGSEFVYHLLPEMRRLFPKVRVIDQLFNDSVHVYNNRAYARYIDHTIVPSESLAGLLVRSNGAGPSSISVIPHGVNVPDDVQPAELPAGFEGKFISGFFGRLSSEKAPKLFVEIARRLGRADDMRFTMTGEGPESEAVSQMIRRHRLSEKIHAPGFVPDAAPLMRAADVVVLPSVIDGMPLAVIEAQLMGKPVVASRVGSLPEMVLDGDTGFLCEIGNVDEFCARIMELKRNPALRARMGERAMRHARERFSADRMIERYLSVIENRS